MPNLTSDAVYIKIDRPSLERAATRLKPARPFVRRISDRQYQVSGSKGAAYVVDLLTVPAGEIAHCSCPAKTVCRHQAAAVIFEMGVRA